MRGCLFTLVLGAIVIGALVVFALPRALEGVITASLATAGFQARETSVKLEQDDPLSLIRLKADRVSISALDATIGDLDVGTVDLVLEDVDLGSRTAVSRDRAPSPTRHTSSDRNAHRDPRDPPRGRHDQAGGGRVDRRRGRRGARQRTA